jgi:hypothetical protein
VGTPKKRKTPASCWRFSFVLEDIEQMIDTLQCLKKHGQRLDHEIAKEMRVPLATVRQHLTALADLREAIVCKTIQFENGRQFEAWQGRVSGFVPPPAPGRKPKSKA